MITVKTYAGKVLGTISLDGGELCASTPALQSIADTALERTGSAESALHELDGWQNGYLFASSDPDATAQ